MESAIRIWNSMWRDGNAVPSVADCKTWFDSDTDCFPERPDDTPQYRAECARQREADLVDRRNAATFLRTIADALEGPRNYKET